MVRQPGFARWVVCGIVSVAGAVAAAGDATISREIARVRADAKASVAPEQLTGVVARLDRAAAAVDAGRTFLALFELQPAFETEAAFSFSAASGVKTQEQFAHKWKAVGQPKSSSPDSRRRVLFAEALAQSAEGKAAATYHASLPYGEDAGLFGGLFYLGESQAFGKFAAFCRSLDLRPAGPAPLLHGLEPELRALEVEILDAYDKAEGAARQPFITVSVTLKLARSLDREGRRAGALLQYLLARYRFALTRPPASIASLPARLAAARTFATDVDHSMAEFFLQLADANAGAADTARFSAAVLDDVLPAYRKVLE